MRKHLSPDDLARRFNQPSQNRRAKPFDDGWVRESFTLPRGQARATAMDWMKRYLPQAYMTEVESYSVLPGDRVEFTMRRLRSAD